MLLFLLSPPICMERSWAAASESCTAGPIGWVSLFDFKLSSEPLRLYWYDILPPPPPPLGGLMDCCCCCPLVSEMMLENEAPMSVILSCIVFAVATFGGCFICGAVAR